MRTEDPVEITKILNKQFESVFEVDNGERSDFDRDKGDRVYDWDEVNDVKESVILEKIKKFE